MKLLLSLIAALLFHPAAYADCITGIMLEMFPAGPTIRPNAVFVLSGTDGGQAIVAGLNSSYDIYLKSGQTKLRLVVVETLVSAGNQSQAVLKPEALLEPGTEYQLCIDNLPEEATRRYAADGPQPVKYLVVPGTDTEAPKLKGKPELLGKTLIYGGCGATTYVVFSNPVQDTTGYLVRTTVTALQTGRKTAYYLESGGPQRNLIRVGTGMCAGAFLFNEGDTYEVAFEFMDASGNTTHWKGSRIRFSKPDRPGGEEFE